MNKKDWFVIQDLDKFVNHSRTIVFNSWGNKDMPDSGIENLLELKQQDKKEINNVLSFDESLVIIKTFVKKQYNKKTSQERFIISEKIYMDILEALGNRMTSNILNDLVNKGIVETAYDSESDDFVFWIKDENTEKPETD